MAYEQKEGQGSLFRNDKQGNERRPDYRGTIKINGKVYRLSAWVKDGQKGKWLSLSAEEEQPKTQLDEAGFKTPHSEFATSSPQGFREEPGDLPF